MVLACPPTVLTRRNWLEGPERSLREDKDPREVTRDWLIGYCPRAEWAKLPV
jgi:hypothetical protein